LHNCFQFIHIDLKKSQPPRLLLIILKKKRNFNIINDLVINKYVPYKMLIQCEKNFHSLPELQAIETCIQNVPLPIASTLKLQKYKYLYLL